MSLFRRISNLFSRSRVDREIEGELKSHIEGISESETRKTSRHKRVPG
jgi:hypothetical protein